MASFHKILLFTVLGLALASCGGGGGGGGTILGGTATDTDDATTDTTFTATITLDPSNLDPDTPGTATVTVTNTAGPIENAAVEFNASIGTLSPNEGIVQTNAEGIATVTLTVPNASATGTLSADVTVDNVVVSAQTVTYIVTFDPPVLQLELQNAAGESTDELTGFEQATVLVTLTDTAGPVVGEIVNLTAGAGVDLGQISGLTDENGQVATTLTGQNITAVGTLQAEVTMDETGVTSSLNYRVNESATDSDFVTTITLQPTDLAPGTPGTVTVSVNNAEGPVEGAVVEFGTSIGVLSPNAGIVQTNADGIAVVTLTVPNSSATGSLGANVTVGSVTESTDSITFVVTSTDTAFTTAIALDITNLNPDTAGTASVTVTNSAGPIEGAIVAFSASIGELSPNEGIIVTDADGVATVTLTVPNASATGTISANVTVNNVVATTESVTYLVTFDPPILQLELLNGSGDPTTDLTGFEQATVRVTLTDSIGPVIGKIVSLSAGGNVVLGQTSGLTDDNGQVITTLTAANVAVAGTLQAEVTLDQTGVSSSLNYRVNEDGTSVGSVNLQLTVDEVTIAPLTKSTASITVTQNDAARTPIEGAVVNFSANGVDLIPASGSVFTNALGIAEIEIRAGGTPGSTQLNVEVVIGEETFIATPINLIVAEALIEIVLSDNVIEANEVVDVQARLVEATDEKSPIAETVVEFSTDIGTFSTTSGLTDADGYLTLQMVGGPEAGEGTITIAASVGGNAVTGIATFQNVGEQATDDNSLVVSVSGMVDAGGTPDNVLAGNETATISATVIEDGAPAGGVSVLFSTNQGQLSATSATTDAVTGIASVELTGVGTAGVAVVEATANLSNGISVAGSKTIQTSSEQPTLQLIDQSDAIIENLELSAAESATVTVLVTDWNGDAVEDLGVLITVDSADQDVVSGKTASGEVDVVLTGRQLQQSGTLIATATFGIFDLTDQINVTSLGVNNTTDNLILQKATLTLGLGNSVLDGNEKVDVSVVVTEGNVVKEGITVQFSVDTGVTLVDSSAVTDATGTATIGLIGQGIAGTALLTASATLSNAIEVSDEVSIQTSATTPTIELVIRNSAGVIVDSFGANQELTLEASITDFDGTDLDTADQGLNVSFTIDNTDLGVFDASEDVAEPGFCPVNGIQLSPDCAVVTLTSSANVVVREITASVTINGIDLSDTITVTNTGVNSGSPDQNSFSITRVGHATGATVSIEGDEYNNQEKVIRVDLADFANNPVPNGTLVEFRTELGDITTDCTTVGGQCEVTFSSSDPRTPANSEVSVRNLVDDACPSQNVMDEIVSVTTVGSDDVALTDYRVLDVMRVVPTGGDGTVDFGVDTHIDEGTDYVVTSNGIECVTCASGTELAITYRRLWLDEEDDGATAHVLLNPGEATEPFVNVTNTPCLAATRAGLQEITGTINPTASTSIVGSGTAFVSELAVGDRLKVSGEVRTIDSITDNTNLTVSVAFSDNLNDISPERIAAPAYQGGLGQPYGGRSTILAFAVGEESFIDVNGNEEYDFGEAFFDLTEAFVDKNEDGVLGDFDGDSKAPVTSPVAPYNDAGLGDAPPGEARDKSVPYCYGPESVVGLNDGIDDSTEQEAYCYEDGGEEETFVDFDGNGLMDVGNGIYNGSRCLRPLQDSDNDGFDDDVVCTTDLLNISRSVEILMAGSFAKLQFRASSGGTTTVGNVPGGTNDGGEIIGSVVSKGNVSLGEQIADGNFSSPTAWTSGASVQIAAGFATIGAVAIEDLLIQDGIFGAGQVHDVSLQITTYNSGDVNILADGDVIATCGSAGTCTATGVVATGRFAISTASGFDGIIDNVSVTATTTGQTATFSGVTVNSNDNTAALTQFEVGDTIDNLTVFPGVSEREGVALATTQKRIYFNVTDRFNGQMPNETTVTVESDNSAGCLLTSVGGKVVTSPTTPGLHSQVLNIGTDMSTVSNLTLEAGSGSGFVVVTVSSPIGNSVTSGFSCTL